MKVLLTGFGPFPGVPVNRSQAIVESMAAASSPRPFDLHVVVLPTVYEEAAATLQSLLQTLRPDLCLCLGVAPGPHLTIERFARNRCTAITPDAAGCLKTGVIDAAGASLYASSLPVPDIVAALESGGFPVELSDDAGGYVCNHTFYVACRAVEALGPHAACGFVHVPAAEGAAACGGLSLDRLRQAIEVVLEVSSRRQGQRQKDVGSQADMHG